MAKPGPTTKDMNEPIPAEVLGMEPVCEADPYPRHEPGDYEAECVSAVTYWHPQLRAWKCRLEFKTLVERDSVFCFLHLGNGETTKAGPRSEYYRVWVLATGHAPRKRQTLSNRVFKGKTYEIRIGDTIRRFDGRNHPDGQIYSTVKEILKKAYP